MLKLDPVQDECVSFLLSCKSAIVNLGIGKGKSLVAMTYMSKLACSKQVVLLVPKSILSSWELQLSEMFGSVASCKFDVVAHSRIQMNLDLIRNADVVIIDEPKMLKGETIFFNLLMSFPRPLEQRRILLDATLIEVKLEDLDNLCLWLGITREDLPKHTFPKNQTDNAAPRPTKTHKIYIHIPANRKPMVKFLELALARTLIPGIRSMQAVQMAIMKLLAELNDPAGIGREKTETIIDIIETRHPNDCGIICASKLANMEAICERLLREGRKAVTYHGKLTAKQRNKIVLDFNAGSIDWVVATKAGERGLDMSRGNVVIHADIPYSGGAFTQRNRVTRRSGDLSIVTRQYVLLMEDSVENVVYGKIKARLEMDSELKNGVVKNVFGISWKQFLIEKFQRLYKIDLVKELSK